MRWLHSHTFQGLTYMYRLLPTCTQSRIYKYAYVPMVGVGTEFPPAYLGITGI